MLNDEESAILDRLIDAGEEDLDLVAAAIRMHTQNLHSHETVDIDAIERTIQRMVDERNFEGSVA
jgi:hypothetical protein